MYQALHRELKRPAAVKLLLADLLSDDEQVRRFDTEARITAALEHPHIVQVLDHGAACRIPWIAYEYLPGMNLRAVLDEHPRGMPFAPAVRAMVQIADAIELAHAHGVLHRDLKPDNVLSADDERWKVGDFGIAKWSGAGAVKTKTGVVLGSPRYLSPEQIEGGTASPASDVYSLGIMLFEMLNGAPPFVDDNLMILLERHLKGEVPRLSLRRPELPRGLDAVIARAVAKKASERYATGGVFRDALAGVASNAFSAGGPSPAGSAAPPALRQLEQRLAGFPGGAPRPSCTVMLRTPAPPRRRVLLVAGLLLATVVAALGAFAVRSRPAPAPVPATPANAEPATAMSAPPAIPRTTGLDVCRLATELYDVRREIADVKRLAPSEADILDARAGIDSVIERFVKGLKQPLGRLAAVVEQVRQLDLDDPACLGLEPLLFDALNVLEASLHELSDRTRAPARTEIIRLARVFRSVPSTGYGAVLHRTTKYPLELLTGHVQIVDTDQRAAASREAADLVSRMEGGRPTPAGLAARLVLTWRMADAYAPHADVLARTDSGAALVARRKVAELGTRVLDVLAPAGDGEIGLDVVEYPPALSSALTLLQWNAIAMAKDDSLQPEERSAALRLWLRVGRAAGNSWWWLNVTNPVITIHQAGVAEHELPRPMDPESERALAELRYVQRFYELAAACRQPGNPSPIVLVRTATTEAGPAAGWPALLLPPAVDVIQSACEERPEAGTALVLDALIAIVQRAARPDSSLAPRARQQLASAVRAAYRTPVSLMFPAKVEALDRAVEEWHRARPGWESAWLHTLLQVRRGRISPALDDLGALLEERFRTLSAAAPLGHGRPVGVHHLLLIGLDLAQLSGQTPGPPPGPRWLPQFEALIAKVGCGTLVKEWALTRSALAR